VEQKRYHLVLDLIGSHLSFGLVPAQMPVYDAKDVKGEYSDVLLAHVSERPEILQFFTVNVEELDLKGFPEPRDVLLVEEEDVSLLPANGNKKIKVRLEQQLEALQWIDVAIHDLLQAVHDPAGRPLEDGNKEPFFAAIVVVDIGNRHSGQSGNIPNGSCIESVGGKELHCRVEQLLRSLCRMVRWFCTLHARAGLFLHAVRMISVVKKQNIYRMTDRIKGGAAFAVCAHGRFHVTIAGELTRWI